MTLADLYCRFIDEATPFTKFGIVDCYIDGEHVVYDTAEVYEDPDFVKDTHHFVVKNIDDVTLLDNTKAREAAMLYCIARDQDIGAAILWKLSNDR